MRGSHALAVRVLAGSHFQHAHAEGVDVDALVVVLFVHFRSHKLGRADDGLGERAVLERGQSQVTDLDAASRARDEDVVALRSRCQDLFYFSHRDKRK